MSAELELIPTLKKLRLSGVLQSLNLRIQQAVDDDVSHSEFLLRILQDEVDRREANQLKIRMRRAKFENPKPLEDFDFAFNPKVPKAKVLELATCAFIDRSENICLIGPAGVGKSHVAQALGTRAVRAGKKTIYLSANRLFADLKAARGDGSFDRVLARVVDIDLLIIDDLGLRPLRPGEPEILFEVISGRYEKASTIFTSNRSIEEWAPLFGDPLLASAAMDRLLHHNHTVTFEGRSYRTKDVSL
jgi:DNA replication protein DnaC